MSFYYNMSFCKTYVSNKWFDKKGLAIPLVPDNPNVLGIVLFTKLMIHPTSLLFADWVSC